jgi:HK97 family phage major capsid protein
MNRLEQIQARLRELADGFTYLGAFDALDDEQRALFDAAVTESDTLIAEQTDLKARQAQLDKVRAAAADPANLERGFTAPNVIVRDDKDDLYRVDRADFYGKSETRVEADMFGRAEKVIDSWEGDWLGDAEREHARKVIKSGQTRADRIANAAHVVRFSDPAYASAFEKMVANPTVGAALLVDHERVAMRAAMSETAANGGYLVPVLIDPTIILTNNGITNPIRGAATVKSINTQTWKGVTSAGVTAEWTAEAAEAADASPTFGQPTITPARADAWLQASFEVLQDTGIGGDIAMLLADAKDRLEGTAFAVGTGSTQPVGVITALGAVTASRVAGSSGAAGAADFVVADVYALKNALPPRHRPNASWLAEQTTYSRIRQFATGSGPQHAFWADLGAALPSLLLGRPALESSAMDNTIVSGSNDDVLAFVDLANYYIIDRIGMSVAYEPLVKGSNRRPTGEAGWFAFWRVGGDMPNPNAGRLLRL